METRALVRIIVLLLLCLAIHTLTSQGQTLYSKDAKITIAPNTTVIIKGSVENSGTFANDGHLKVAGPWVNSGTYQPGEGEVTFNSTSATVPQIIHHNGQIFNTVTLTGGTKKILLSDLGVAREIRFEDGVVEVAGSSKVTFEEGASISGASDVSHIYGPVYHKGSGSKLFPIGNGLLYLPVELMDVTDPSSVIGVHGFEFENLVLSKNSSLQSISDQRYWHIDVASGSLGDAQVVLPLRDESWISDPERVVVAQSSAPGETFISIGKSYLQGASPNGRVASATGVTMPFVALATSATELIVYNAVSPNGDDKNDFLRIENIEFHAPNKFSLFNRWGDKIFEIENYDNDTRAFRGRANLFGDREVETGTYFYVLDLPQGESLRGYISVKR